MQHTGETRGEKGETQGANVESPLMLSKPTQAQVPRDAERQQTQATSRTTSFRQAPPEGATEQHRIQQPQQGPSRRQGDLTAEVYVAGRGPGDGYKVGGGSSDPPFDRIRVMCASDILDVEVDMSPTAFASHRKDHWPHFIDKYNKSPDIDRCVHIYEAVRKTGIPNCMGARVPVESNLNIPAWERYADWGSDEAQLMDYLKYGFPLGYMGPISNTSAARNHPSALRFPQEVGKFVDKEKEMGALVGPFLATPFTPWAHVSPLMTRPKAEATKRRVISDLTFPEESSVNAYIFKNSIVGQVRDHSLPTVAAFVEDIKQAGEGAFMFTVDIERAYKNFRVDPLDWPLMCVGWEGGTYIETAMPFGARSSSSNMQRVADMIVRILGQEGIRAKMYLDDLIVAAPSLAEAQAHFVRVQALLEELGLPQARDKTQPPGQRVRWLGIDISTVDMSLSIPPDKLSEVVQLVGTCANKKTIHRRQYESLIGKLMFIAKCVAPARTFMSRLLQALRDTSGWFVRVNQDVRDDLAWFLEFSSQWNGVAIIPPDSPNVFIQVDASLTGIGASDGRRAYAGRIAEDHAPATNINEVEAINVIIALHSFISQDHRGQHMLVQCDNLAAVQAIRHGRGRNPVLTECARLAWMVQAVLDVRLTFAHIAGADNKVADALSRAHMSAAHFNRAETLVRQNYLVIIQPCLHALDHIHLSMTHRPGVQLAPGQGGDQTNGVQGDGNEGGSRSRSTRIGGVRAALPDGPGGDVGHGDVYVDRVPRGGGTAPGHDKEQSLPRQGVCKTRGRLPGGGKPLQSGSGTRRGRETQGIPIGCKGPSAGGGVSQGDGNNPGRQGGDRIEGGLPHNLLRHAEAVGGGAPFCRQIRPKQTPDVRRHQDGRPASDNTHKMGQELTRVQPDTGGDPLTHGERWYLSGRGHQTCSEYPSGPITAGAPPGVRKDSPAHHNSLSQNALGGRADRSWRASRAIWTTQPQKGVGNGGGEGRLHRIGSAKARRMEVRRPSHIHQDQRLKESAIGAKRFTQ